MAKENAKPEVKAEAEAPKKERRVLTDEERIAKLEADLRAAKEKKEAKNKKAIDSLLEKRKSLTDKVDELKNKIQRINEDLAAAGYTGDKTEATFTETKLEAV